MRYYKRAGGPGKGLFPEDQRGIPMVNRTGSTLVKGAIVQVDERSADAASTSQTPGEEGSCFRNVITPVAGDSLRSGTFMVYEGSASLVDDAEGLFCLVGIALCDIEDGAVTLANELTPTAAALALDADGTAAGQKVVAKALETRASGSATVTCFFNGYGFGQMTA